MLLSSPSPSTLDDDEEDEGHTVVATARGIFNCNGGVLSSIETGVSIIIPQGAIPESVEQEIYFKVCRDNNILPPLDKEKGRSLGLFYRTRAFLRRGQISAGINPATPCDSDHADHSVCWLMVVSPVQEKLC